MTADDAFVEHEQGNYRVVRARRLGERGIVMHTQVTVEKDDGNH